MPDAAASPEILSPTPAFLRRSAAPLPLPYPRRRHRADRCLNAIHVVLALLRAFHRKITL
jgi:hypothetical protein